MITLLLAFLILNLRATEIRVKQISGSRKALGILILNILAVPYLQAPLVAQEPAELSGSKVSFITVLSPALTESLDSQIAIDETSLVVINNIQEGLYEYNMEGKPVPVLAEDFPRQVSPRTYTIPLRRGILFQNGSILKASDVIFTFKRLIDPEVGVLSLELFDAIKIIEEENQFTVKVILKKKISNLVELLSRHELFPLSETAVNSSQTGYGWITATGTGPFQFKEWFRGNRVVLTRNELYWMNRILETDTILSLNLFEWNLPGSVKLHLPMMDSISINMIGDPTQREEQMKKGVADVIINAQITDLQNFHMDKKFRIVGKPSTNLVQIYLNTSNAPFNNSKIRQALTYLIDRDKLVREVFYGFAMPASSTIPGWHWAHDPSIPLNMYQPATAKKILGSLGINDKTPLKFTLIYTNAPYFETIASWLKDHLQKHHIHVTLKPLPKQVLFDYVYGRNGKDRSEFQAALEDWQDWQKTRSPAQFIQPLYFSSSSENKVGYHNVEVDRLILLSALETNIQRKQFMYHRLEKITTESHSTVVLCVPDVCYITRSELTGFNFSHAGDIRFRACR